MRTGRIHTGQSSKVAYSTALVRFCCGVPAGDICVRILAGSVSGTRIMDRCLGQFGDLRIPC